MTQPIDDLAAHRVKLRRVHELRQQEHWGKNAPLTPWPETDADWRQTSHGAPWDTNVLMAMWHLTFARKLQKEGLLDD